jgi:hypothetical protein
MIHTAKNTIIDSEIYLHLLERKKKKRKRSEFPLKIVLDEWSVTETSFITL